MYHSLSFHIVVLLMMAKNVPKHITHIKSDCFFLLFCGILVVIAIVVALNKFPIKDSAYF